MTEGYTPWGSISKQSAIDQIIWELQNVNLTDEQLQIIYRKVYLFANSADAKNFPERTEETVVDREGDEKKSDWACISNEKGHDVFGKYCGNHLQRITSIDQIERIGSHMLGKESNPEDMNDTLREYIRKYGVWVKREWEKEKGLYAKREEESK